MPKSFVVIATIIVIIIAAGFVVSSLGQKSSVKQPVSTTNTTVEPSRPVSVSTGAPVNIAFRGSVTAVSSANITVKGGAETKTFSLGQTIDMRKIASGTLEGGNAKIEKAALLDLKEGQEVLVIASKDTSNVLSILIIK